MDDAERDIGPLLPLALQAIADLLDTDTDRLPAGIEGVLRHYGAACHQKGDDAGYDRAFNEPTIRTKTDPAFPVVSSKTFPKGTVED